MPHLYLIQNVSLICALSPWFTVSIEPWFPYKLPSYLHYEWAQTRSKPAHIFIQLPPLEQLRYDFHIISRYLHYKWT